MTGKGGWVANVIQWWVLDELSPGFLFAKNGKNLPTYLHLFFCSSARDRLISLVHLFQSSAVMIESLSLLAGHARQTSAPDTAQTPPGALDRLLQDTK